MNVNWFKHNHDKAIDDFDSSRGGAPVGSLLRGLFGREAGAATGAE
jgi:hypothetical protein